MADGRWDDVDSVAFDEDFVRGATIHELDHRRRRKAARRQRRQRRQGRRRRRPDSSTLACIVVFGTLFGLLGAGAFGVGPAAFVAGSLGIGDDAEDVIDAAEPAAVTVTSIALATTTTLHHLEGGGYRPGDCIIWDDEDRITSDVPVKTVPCDEPHFFEVTGSTDLPGAMNYPASEATWDVLSVEHCDPMTLRYLGHPLVSTGRFWAGMIHPTEEGWRAGDRTVHCGLETHDANWNGENVDRDTNTAFTGRVKDQSEEWVPPAGTCFGTASDGDGVELVPCAGAHKFEVSGHVGLEGRFDHAPTEEELRRRIDGDCRGVAARYLGRPLRRDEWTGWMPISDEEWAAGWRTLPCTVGRVKGGDWAPVTGSLAAQ